MPRFAVDRLELTAATAAQNRPADEKSPRRGGLCATVARTHPVRVPMLNPIQAAHYETPKPAAREL